ncbi:hypothetical protein [Hydrogenimonas sp.]|uniref:hypothetical protein n=1 Tax=Hydrogenimonas sp. TaxID=2231112 RepID=UPI002602BA17|nr:hypothetical protein [Hydrogenimonas sp.]
MTKALFSPLSMAIFLHAADLNDTLIRDTTQTCESLPASLKKKILKSDDTALWKALLHKLVNLSKNHPAEKIVIKRIDDRINLLRAKKRNLPDAKKGKNS